MNKIILAGNSFRHYFGFLKNNILLIFLYESLICVLTKQEQQTLSSKKFRE